VVKSDVDVDVYRRAAHGFTFAWSRGRYGGIHKRYKAFGSDAGSFGIAHTGQSMEDRRWKMEDRGRSGGGRERLRGDTARSEGLIARSGMVDTGSPLGDPRNLKELQRHSEKYRYIWNGRCKKIRCKRYRGFRIADIVRSVEDTKKGEKNKSGMTHGER
jgi:hypothetical protein